MSQKTKLISVVMLGATGAVGTQVLKSLLNFPNVQNISILGRRPVENISTKHVQQHKIDVFNTRSYELYLTNSEVAICTFGVGQPSKVSKEDFIKIDKTAVIDFAKACKKAGVRHFELLASVGINAKSTSFYLRTKGELVNELKSLQFDRLSIFQPSMILTPTNRYGILQGLNLLIWPLISPILIGPLKKYRSIKVEALGTAIAKNILSNKSGEEKLTWQNFKALLN